jgi:hypothetical protein
MTDEQKEEVLKVVEGYLDDLRRPEPDVSLLSQLWNDLQGIFGVDEH